MFGEPVTFKLKGGSHLYQNRNGGVFSLLVGIGILYNVVTRLIVLFSRSDASITHAIQYDYFGFSDNFELPFFAFGVSDFFNENGDPLDPDYGEVKFYFEQWNLSDYSLTEVPTVPCSHDLIRLGSEDDPDYEARHIEQGVFINKLRCLN